jgi:anti-sigma B factor antagonist/stage II sporulation protein AA (anti-sigma F factor antagonist)
MEDIVSITDEQKGDMLVLRIKGRLDAVSSPAAEKKIFEYINNGHHKLVMSFENVDYLSSAGMRMLLSTTKKLKTLYGKLVVCSITTNVMDVLKMSGFDHVLDIVPSEDEAMRKF